MNDRELLELAARAIGGEYDHLAKSISFDGGFNNQRWDPLDCISDAKNLRHRLHMSTGYKNYSCGNQVFGDCAYCTYESGTDSLNSIMEPIGEAGSKRKALRRAITRAAAEIGRAMK